MFSKIRSIIIIVLCFTTLTIFAPLYIVALMIFGPAKTVWLRQWYGKILIFSTFCHLEVSGLIPDKSRAFIYVANHQSMFDALMVAAAIPGNFSVIAKKGLLNIPVFGSVVKRMGFIFIDRLNRQAAGRSIALSADKIRSGTSVLIFPEGTRTKTGAIGLFKSGAFILARATKAPLVLVGISGSYEANPNGWNFYPGVLKINFDRPIESAEYNTLSNDELSYLVRERIIKLTHT